MNLVETPLDHRSQLPSQLIGQTPLVRLRPFERRGGMALYAKLESRNPGGSIKDRAALAMMLAGERAGTLGSGQVLLDATSGNTGIAYAMLCAERGYRAQLCLPENVTPERKRVLRAFGAELVFTDPLEGSDGAIREARRRYESDQGTYFYPDQYSNAENWRTHFRTTADEIIGQTGGRITHFVSGLGTSGTFVGVSRRLRQWRGSVRRIAVQPDSPLHGIEGLKHMESSIVPAIYDPSLAHEHLTVATEDAQTLTCRLARECGIFAGPSSGAALAAGLQIAASSRAGLLVMVFPDGGDHYLSERFWTRSSLWLPGECAQAVKSHAAATYPDECCGALIGQRDGVVSRVLALDNVAPTMQGRRFLVPPEAYAKAEANAESHREQLLGFYHSHPDHPAVPSQFDLDHAWPHLSYAIVSVVAGQSRELRSWRLRSDRSGFDEESVTGSSF